MTDLRDSDLWRRVEDHFTKLHGPAFGRPHRLLEPSVSRDGTTVVVTAELLDRLEGRPRQAPFVVADGDLRALPGVASGRRPRLSPDGETVAVLSDDAEPGRHQLVVVRLDGSAIVSAPPVPGTVEYAEWSPDGARILLGVAGLGADLAGGQGSGQTYRPVEPLPEWYPRVDSGVAEDDWRSLWIYDVASGGLERLSRIDINVWEAAWLGASSVIAVTSPQPDEGAWYTATLARIDLGGEVTTALRPDDQLGWPSGSPDGSRFAFVQAVCSDRWVVAGDLWIGTADGTLLAVDTGGIDVTATQWIDDARLGVIGLRGVETVAAIVNVSTGTTSEIWSSTESSCGTRYPEAAWTADARAVFIEDGYQLPQRVVMVADRESFEVLAHNTHPGTDHLLSIAGSAQPVAWTAPDGLALEGILCTPAGPPPYPLVINIHGGPVWAFRNQWQLFYPWTPLLVAAGYAVLSPNPRGSGGRGQAFARMVFGDMGGDDTWDFTSAADALVERGLVDPERIGLMGGSYGGFMSAWLVTQDSRWAAAMPTSPVTDWYSQHFTSNIGHFDALFLAGDPEKPGDNFHARSPVLHASSVRTPCLNVAGALDRCTPPTQAQEFHQALLEFGVESELVIYPQEGHGVRAFPALIDYCTRVLDWFERHMPAQPRGL